MKKKTWLLSVALVALMGLSAPVFAHDGEEGHGKGQQCDVHRLSETKREILHQAMKASFEKDKPLFEKAHKLHKELRDIVKADTFDAAAYMKTKAEIEAIHSQIQKNRDEAFASVAVQFTPDERKELIHMWRHHHHHKRHEHKWSKNKDQQDSGAPAKDSETH